MATQLVPVISGVLADEPAQLVNARDLHTFLEVGRDFSNWITGRIEEYGFVENQDFGIFAQIGEKSNRGRGRPSKEYCLSLDMAKELAMVERNEKGRIIRRYFIECEKRLRAIAPEQAQAAAQATNPSFRPEKTRKALPGGLSVEQQDAVKALVKSRVEVLPHDAQAKAAITCWSAIKSKFGVTYKEVPAAHFAEVLSLVARLPLEQEPPKALPFEIHFPLESAAPPVGMSGLSYYAFAQAEGWVDPGWELLLKLRDAGHNVEGPIYSHRAKIHVMTAMYDALIGKAQAAIRDCCASLPYAPVYLR